jgi:hypothetical protein
MTGKYQVKNRDSAAERLLDRSIQEVNLPNNLFECSILFLFISAQLITHRPEPKTCFHKSILALLQSKVLIVFQENVIQKNIEQSSHYFSFK